MSLLPFVKKRCDDCTACPKATGKVVKGMYVCAKKETPTLPTQGLTVAQMEEYAARAAQQDVYEWQKQFMGQIAGGQLRYQQGAVTRYRPIERDYQERRGDESFLSPRLTERIAGWVRRDSRFDLAWSMFTHRVRHSLNDYIVEGFCHAMGALFTEWDHHADRLVAKHMDELNAVKVAGNEVLKAYEAAQARGDDVTRLTEAIEELDATLYELDQKDT